MVTFFWEIRVIDIISVTRRSRSDSRYSLTHSLTESVSVSTDLTDVTLVSDDTYWRLGWCYSSNWGYCGDDEEDCTDVTLVSDDTNWRLDWCYSNNWGSDESYQVVKVIMWWKLSSDQSYQVMKVILWWKLSSDESYLVMKLIQWWKLFSDESLRSWNCQKKW